MDTDGCGGCNIVRFRRASCGRHESNVGYVTELGKGVTPWKKRKRRLAFHVHSISTCRAR